MIARVATLIALLALPAVGFNATAAPSVFVRNQPGFSWWTREMEARVLGRAVGPITTQVLSAFIEEDQVYGPYRVCALEAVQADTYVGMDRTAQADIDATRPHVQWRAEAVAPGGRRILGQAVLFEGCETDDPRGAAILITDQASGQILRWVPLGNRVSAGREFPGWTVFVLPKQVDGEELFSFSSCSECGDRVYVYYDLTRRRVYLEDAGH